MKFRFLVFLLLPVSILAQTPEYQNRFGCTIGYKTPGGGLAFEYTRLWSWHFSSALFAGTTAVNGLKYGAGIKYYPLKDKKVLPFLTTSFSRTTGGTPTFSSAGTDDCVTAQFETGTFHENYKTYPNNYLNFSGGIELGKNRTQHSFALGYSLLLNSYRLDIDPGNDKSAYLGKVKSNLRGGVILSYTISFSLHYNSYKGKEPMPNDPNQYFSTGKN